jgi:hypothetical protein
MIPDLRITELYAKSILESEALKKGDDQGDGCG